MTNKKVYSSHTKSSLEVGSLSLASVFTILLQSWIILSSWWFAHLCGRIVFFMLSSDHKMADFHLLCKQKEKSGHGGFGIPAYKAGLCLRGINLSQNSLCKNVVFMRYLNNGFFCRSHLHGSSFLIL